MIFGIDYGSKLAGTTVIAMGDHPERLRFFCSCKNADADTFIGQLIQELRPSLIGIDAPLSLPLVYQQPDLSGASFFYRQADKAINAMSPMFLGGLTARAMQLKASFSSVDWIEVYPGGLVKIAQLEGYSKKDKSLIPAFIGMLKAKYGISVDQEVKTWHEVDAMLAWFASYRYLHGHAIAYGNPAEGLIFV
ncbi:hypothetical protein [Penaeicola halotolerans]|uniref:hypothetical protein n=1 Tax=Penaeicola halotolerans TaxID=2793196 RepID=UPI001CF7FDB9|nr:hypothetical protein [Penaeicola halotolerans]